MRSFRARALLVALAAGVSACASPDSPNDDDSGADDVGDSEVHTEVTHYAQPMVVDVYVELDSPGAVELEHADDPGVKIGLLDESEDQMAHAFRVRGLAPDTDHSLILTTEDGVERSVDFTTDPPLTGFRPGFEVELPADGPVDPSYRIFDYAYTPLFSPAGIFAVDPEGRTRWYWGVEVEQPGPNSIWAGLQLRPDGTLLTTHAGAVTVLDELGEARVHLDADDYGFAEFHHDVIELPSGNFLVLSNSFRDIEYQDLGTVLVAGDLLVELAPNGDLIWTWDSFDHLDPQRRRAVAGEGLPYFDPDSGQASEYDWTHGNGVVYTAEDDLIVLSLRHQDWLVAIDHQSGEVVWRLGDEGDFALLDGTWFFRQHSPQWQGDGSMLLYDNAVGNPDVPVADSESRAVRYALDFDAMTATQVWEDAAEPFVSAIASDADRTPNGNVLALDSALQPDPEVFDVGQNYSRIREIGPDDQRVWSLTTKLGSMVYRATASERLPGEAGG